MDAEEALMALWDEKGKAATMVTTTMAVVTTTIVTTVMTPVAGQR